MSAFLIIFVMLTNVTEHASCEIYRFEMFLYIQEN